MPKNNSKTIVANKNRYINISLILHSHSNVIISQILNYANPEVGFYVRGPSENNSNQEYRDQNIFEVKVEKLFSKYTRGFIT